MYLCASTFGWTPKEVKELSRRELEALLKAGDKLQPALPSTKTGLSETTVSSMKDVQQFIRKH